MNIVTLDLGSNMALAHNIMGDVVVTDHKMFDGIRAHRLGAILSWLDKRFDEIEAEAFGTPVIVVYERPFSRGFDATRSGWGLAGLIEALATNHGWAVTDQTPAAVKSFALGKIKRVKMSRAERAAASIAEKQNMIAAAQGMGYAGENEHEADAFLLLKFAEAHIVVLPKGKKKNAAH